MADRERASHSGHRQRLREKALRRSESLTEAERLELLLSYAIPRKDVRPVAERLLGCFGDLSRVLSASRIDLKREQGIGEHAAALLTLVGQIRSQPTSVQKPEQEQTTTRADGTGVTLFDLPSVPDGASDAAADEDRLPAPPTRSAGLFTQAVLAQAIDLLPGLPNTRSPDAARKFFQRALHYSALETRERYASYIVKRLFPYGFVDRPLLAFSRKFAGADELREVCFYRFMIAEPLIQKVIVDLLLPRVGAGEVARAVARDFLAELFPKSGSVGDGTQAIVAALSAGGLATSSRTALRFAYRDIRLASFAFVLHSEFPEPGMYDFRLLDQKPRVSAMMWSPAQIVPMLYEMRNIGIISKVSEIDNIRQFTTRMTLGEVIERLPSKGGP